MDNESQKPFSDFDYEVIPQQADPPPPDGHLSGGLPMISDSAFSLVILVYVSVAFCFVFFMFCWKTAVTDDNGKKQLQRQCVMMTSNDEERIRKKNADYNEVIDTTTV